MRKFSVASRQGSLGSHVLRTVNNTSTSSYLSASRGKYYLFVPDMYRWDSSADIFGLEAQLDFASCASSCFGADMTVVTLRDKAKLVGSFTDGALAALKPHFEVQSLSVIYK